MGFGSLVCGWVDERVIMMGMHGNMETKPKWVSDIALALAFALLKER